MAKYGPIGFYPQTNFCDYPPAYTYILGLNSIICGLFPAAGPGFSRFIFRLFPSLCDIFSCIVLDRFIRKRDQNIPEAEETLSLLLLAFHPVSILNSAAWGQMDSVLSFLLLLVALWVAEGKWQYALPVYTLSVLVKPQALMLGFLGLASAVQVWIREKDARRKLIRGAIASAVVILVILFPSASGRIHSGSSISMPVLWAPILTQRSTPQIITICAAETGAESRMRPPWPVPWDS